MVKGPLHRHRHGLLARRAWAWASTACKPLRLGVAEPPAHPALLPPRRPERPRRACSACTGTPSSRARVGQPHHLRLRPHARDLAHPPLHRLDGRRRLALEARLRVPQVQLRRRHALAARHASPRKYLADGDRPAVDLELAGRRTSAASVTTPGHATILLPSREHGPVRLPDPPGGATSNLAGRDQRRVQRR